MSDKVSDLGHKLGTRAGAAPPRVMPAYLLHQKQHDTNLLFALLLEAMSDDGSDDGCIPLMDKASLIDDDDREALRAFVQFAGLANR